MSIRRFLSIFAVSVFLIGTLSMSNAAHVPGETIIQLTDNDYDDKGFQINERGDILWLGYDGNDWEIFLAPRKSE